MGSGPGSVRHGEPGAREHLGGGRGERLRAVAGVAADDDRRPRPAAARAASAASPAVVRRTTATFIPFGPARTGPRSPAVPNRSVPAMRSARSAAASRSPVSAAASTRCSSTRVSGSGSSAIHRIAASRSAGVRRHRVVRYCSASRRAAHQVPQQRAHPLGRGGARRRAPPGGRAARPIRPAARFVTSESPNTSTPSARAAIASSTVDMPTRSAPSTAQHADLRGRLEVRPGEPRVDALGQRRVDLPGQRAQAGE